MTYEINPCEACINKYKDRGCNVNDLSGCCYETLGAFMGTNDSLQIYNTPQANNAIECVHNKIVAMGRDPCDLRVPPKPIIPTAPHYFPEIFRQSGDKKAALNTCLFACRDCHNPNTCKENCITDANSVVMKEKYNQQKEKETTYLKVAKSHPIIFWVFFIITAVLLSIVLTKFYNILTNKNVKE